MTQPETGATAGPPGRGRATAEAAVAAAGVLAVLVVQRILFTLVSLIGYAGTDLGDAGSLYDLSLYLGGLLQETLVRLLPFALGVFLVLRFVVPVEPGMRLSRVVLGGLLATVAGMLAVIVVAVLLAFAGAVTGLNFFGFSFPDLGGAFRSAWYAVLQGVTGAFGIAVANAPLVVLAALLLREWRRAPRGGAGGTAL